MITQPQNLIKEIKKRVFTCYNSDEDAEIGFNEVKKYLLSILEGLDGNEKIIQEFLKATPEWLKQMKSCSKFYEGQFYKEFPSCPFCGTRGDNIKELFDATRAHNAKIKSLIKEIKNI